MLEITLSFKSIQTLTTLLLAELQLIMKLRVKEIFFFVIVVSLSAYDKVYLGNERSRKEFIEKEEYLFDRLELTYFNVAKVTFLSDRQI